MAAQPLALGVDIGGSALRVAAAGDPAHVSRAAIGPRYDGRAAAGGAHRVRGGGGRWSADRGNGDRDPLVRPGRRHRRRMSSDSGADRRRSRGGRRVRVSRRRVEVVPDLAAAAVGEYRYGSGRGVERFLCVALGTGANAAAIVYGRVVDTAFGCLGDAGHVLVEPDGPDCACGGRGCLEAVASGWALQQAAIAAGAAGRPRPDRCRSRWRRAGARALRACRRGAGTGDLELERDDLARSRRGRRGRQCGGGVAAQPRLALNSSASRRRTSPRGFASSRPSSATSRRSLAPATLPASSCPGHPPRFPTWTCRSTRCDPGLPQHESPDSRRVRPDGAPHLVVVTFAVT